MKDVLLAGKKNDRKENIFSRQYQTLSSEGIFMFFPLLTPPKYMKQNLQNFMNRSFKCGQTT